MVILDSAIHSVNVVVKVEYFSIKDFLEEEARTLFNLINKIY